MTLPVTSTTPVEPATFGLLGPLLVTDVHGTVIHIPQTKQRIIMAALLLRANATVSGDQLAEALWHDKPPPNALAVIRTYVARLRRTLGQVAARLVSRPTGYAIEVHEPGEFDLGVLERFHAESREAAEAGQWERAALSSHRALDLWRGAPLEDIPSATLHRSAIGWLDELRMQLATARIDAELHLGRENYLMAELRQFAGEHPLREHIQAQLMLAYYRCGRQAEALEVYRRVRACLVDDLGVEPGPELRQLHQHILAADPLLNSPPWSRRLPRIGAQGDAVAMQTRCRSTKELQTSCILRSERQRYMKPSIKGRTMRVATTFTGAAACAVAFAPTAMAGTGHPVATQTVHQINTMGPDGRTIHPLSMHVANCLGSNQSHWLHLANAQFQSTTDICFGDRGSGFWTTTITSFCGGNNHGYISGNYVGPGGHHKYSFGPGTTYRPIPLFNVSKEYIKSFTQNDKCSYR
jgi:DNA-binding SARP family transcriptional activator